MLKTVRRICHAFRQQVPVTQVPPTAAVVAEILGAYTMTVVDAGARSGVGEAWFRLRPLAKLIGFEPDAEECARLNESVAAPLVERYVAAALGSHSGPAVFHRTVAPMCSSLLPPDGRLADRYPVLEVMREVGAGRIPLMTLAEWARQEDVQDVRFLKLDTQGSELAILRGAGPVLTGCLGIEVEVEFAPLYLGQPLFADVDSYLRHQGFVLWRLGGMTHYSEEPAAQRLHRRALTYYDDEQVSHPVGNGRLMWGNALYFRDYRGRTDERELLILAALLNAAGDDDGARASIERSLTLGEKLGPAERQLLSRHASALGGPMARSE